MKTYRDLMVWRKGIDFVTEIYRATKNFPQSEIYGLTSQLRRAAISIPSDIAEGYGRYSTLDYVRFLRMAVGSLFESQTHLEIAKNLGYLENVAADKLGEMSREIERMISSLIKKLEVAKQG